MKKLLLLLSLAGTITALQAQTDLYSIDSIQDIQITFGFSDWDYRLDTAIAGTESDIIAQTVVINGISFDSVGVRYKGNSTYSATRVKNPLHITLDLIKKDQDYQGYTDLKLSNAWSDPSFVREVLSYEILRNYMHAPLSNWANVQINGSLIGLYVSSESINKDFCAEHFYSSDGCFIKGNPSYTGGPGGGTPDLIYQGTDSTLYTDQYELKSDYGWAELIDLCDTLKNYSANAEYILDIDRALWMLAFNNVVVNLDSYSGAFKQNYYLYRDENSRFNPVIWDMNMSFGSFTMAGGPGGFLDLNGMQNMTPLLHASDNNWPLIRYLLQQPQYLRMYVAHMKTIWEEQINTDDYYVRAQELQSIIDAAVLADPNKLYTYADFGDNLSSTVVSGGGPFGGICGIEELMSVRKSYLSGTSEFGYVAPTISGLAHSPSTVNLFDSVSITATINGSTYAYLGYRSQLSDKFIHLTMYDDGNHADGAAGDFVFGATIYANAPNMQYYLYAEDADAGIFSPVRAEHEFHVLNVNIPEINPGDIRINEIVAQNTAGQMDEAAEFEDWIELHNNTGSDIFLTGLYLSDNAGNRLKWPLPIDAVLSAGGYMAIWCDEDGSQGSLHASFKLNALGEDVSLAYASGTIVDSVHFMPTAANRSYARCVDGTGAFSLNIIPSFEAYNSCEGAGLDEMTAAEAIFRLYPNPTSGALFIESSLSGEVSVYDMYGQLMEQAYIRNGESQLDLSAYPAGVYVLQSAMGSQRFVKR